MPIIFGEEDAHYASVDEARAVFGELMALHNAPNADVAKGRATLPLTARFVMKGWRTSKTTHQSRSGRAGSCADINGWSSRLERLRARRLRPMNLPRRSFGSPALMLGSTSGRRPPTSKQRRQ
jgi:hypothetical protein